ncbi:uncharacterized protein GGS22DRAFT_23129 [Annulohypoxylon maeteangense]|uniref:uncharacterized protein n=1 Tax=Annulohypoxylon maeteangense TaxID=1927788 RepID=UPI002007E727|nr:uncharacterized protein GGS22DRAFT_23129 [Annulohypoxylon maeteangense]KAI0884434.1 hypothetical protein GGS22DRAFT_23129 [Annulohypoxylon maeteangense]
MADQPRRRRNRPDSKQMWDESDRRNRNEPNARDKRDDRGRDRDEPPRERERDRRYRSRSRSPRRDRRDKNRDRRDRDRNLDRGRPRENDEARPRADERREKNKNKGDRHRDRDEPAPKGPARDRSPRRSASPARSPAGKVDRNTHNNSPLPTRPRPGGKAESGLGSSLQFKVGGKHDDDANRGGKSAAGGKFYDARGSTDEAEDRRRRTETPNSDRGDAMDEDVDEEDVVVEDDGLSAMQAMMGFGGFGTTKGAHIPGNNAGAVRKEKKTEYRQYMNRIGGFNRPLSPSR